ncbi:hypothetical protein Taro_016857 [Colocasia esculenta]|uniref:Uncharacterized protein n=1 Tax=Colocasia esculenta TaxID=4460 RepID=A0A843UU88_COLES|nr:hypothetical protein [Colocasia esculenta]
MPKKGGARSPDTTAATPSCHFLFLCHRHCASVSPSAITATLPFPLSPFARTAQPLEAGFRPRAAVPQDTSSAITTVPLWPPLPHHCVPSLSLLTNMRQHQKFPTNQRVLSLSRMPSECPPLSITRVAVPWELVNLMLSTSYGALPPVTPDHHDNAAATPQQSSTVCTNPASRQHCLTSSMQPDALHSDTHELFVTTATTRECAAPVLIHTFTWVIGNPTAPPRHPTIIKFCPSTYGQESSPCTSVEVINKHRKKQVGNAQSDVPFM